MDISRRSFIRWVLSGAAAMACPFPSAAREKTSTPPPGRLKSEDFTVCHQVRDGSTLPAPPPDLRCDVAIVGGGPSGLAAADELKSVDYLLLEKEGQLGGNCFSESWEGCGYSTAAAWDSIADPDFAALAKRWKFDWKPISGTDTAVYDGVWIRDFWNGRADNPAFDKLPYSQSIKDGFRQFLRDIENIDLPANIDALDARPFSEFLEGYPPQLKSFWDAFGPSNWGARSELTSGYVGISVARDWFRSQRYSWEGGIGIASLRVLDSIPAADRRRLLTKAVAYNVSRRGEKAYVSFFHDGKPRTIEARSIIMATPKFITQHIVEGIPEDQTEAMAAMRYAPFMVYNLCFDRMVYNKGYDTWPIGSKNFTDFIPADWVTNAEGGDPGRKQVLTVYAPQAQEARADLLDDDKVLSMAHAAAAELTNLLPGSLEHLREVRIHRRGHPMTMSIPGHHTRLQPLARRDLPPIYFAHSDAQGEISDFFYAALSGISAARKTLQHL